LKTFMKVDVEDKTSYNLTNQKIFLYYIAKEYYDQATIHFTKEELTKAKAIYQEINRHYIEFFEINDNLKNRNFHILIDKLNKDSFK